MTLPSVGIIGAGLSGLMAARTLQDAGFEVVLFDKGRRPGGRANTRVHGSRRFDHGAQFFTVRDPAMQPLLDAWIDDGVVERWHGTLVRIDGDQILPAKISVRYVGVPGMAALPEYLARGLDVRSGVRVDSITMDRGRWAFCGEDGATGSAFDLAIIAVPAPQAEALLTGAPDLQRQAASVEMAPCWATMLCFEDRLKVEFDGAFLTGDGLSWIARNNSKPGRGATEAWVLHASPAWTRKNAALAEEQAAAALTEQLTALVSSLPNITFQRAHRWGFALPSGSVPGGPIFDRYLGIGACGDWCVGGRVEGAMLSGIRMAEAIIENHNFIGLS
jgi:predicted NAD/FAD-dependent oxidoreductase